jgi:hypothetical protein
VDDGIVLNTMSPKHHAEFKEKMGGITKFADAFDERTFLGGLRLAPDRLLGLTCTVGTIR